MSLQIESHHFDPRPILPLQLAAKRYSWSSPTPSSPNTYTLVLLHGAGFIKESWEPVIRRLFEKTSSGQVPFAIDEAWAIDAQNQGESAGLNAEALLQPPYNEIFDATEWSLATYHFLNSRLGLDGGLKPSNRKLVGIGHSMGAVTLLHLAETHPDLFTSLTLLDPILFPRQFDAKWALLSRYLVASAYQRRDVWPSKKAALKDLKANGMKSWDNEEVELFVEYGIHPHPASRFEVPYGGVTLCATREQEASLYRGGDLLRKPVLPHLPAITQTIPIHVAFGEINDSVPRVVQDTLTDRSLGNNFVTVSRVPNAGHLVVQQNPAGSADAVANALTHLASNPVYIPAQLPEAVIQQAPTFRQRPIRDSIGGGAVLQAKSRL